MTMPDSLETQHTLTTAVARYNELRARDLLASAAAGLGSGCFVVTDRGSPRHEQAVRVGGPQPVDRPAGRAARAHRIQGHGRPAGGGRPGTRRDSRRGAVSMSEER